MNQRMNLNTKKNHTLVFNCLLLVSALFLANACGNPGNSPANNQASEKMPATTQQPNQAIVEKPVITVSILPQKYFVQRLAGNRFEINVIIPPGHSPDTYAPSPRQMKEISRSKLFFLIGYIPLEKTWFNHVKDTNPNLLIVDTSKGINMISGGHHHHEEPTHHHPQENHEQPGIDPHSWLSPQAVKIQVNHMLQALIKIDPANRTLYEKNYTHFISDINNLDQEIKTMLQPHQGKKFMVFHPAWSYFARDFQLEQVPIEQEGKTPSPTQMKRVIDTARQANIKIIFVQKQFDTHSADAIATEIGAKVAILDPLAEDWLTNMKTIASTLAQTFNN